MQQFDQYAIPFTIAQDGVTITPDNIDDVVIRIGSYQLSYSEGELSYNAEDEVWEFPMTQEMSGTFNVYENFQVMLISGDNKVLSPVQIITINPSIIEVAI